ncbi:MAG: hypothetical protein JST76_06520 [Bacteroidetes bacterium]|nr:hypothetical protein [Bacteroidota bacterium]
MTAADFNKYWASAYSKTLPISYRFKLDYPDRWLRIHSLPLSQRYAATEDEWQIILDRQNKVFTDLICENGSFILVYCHYFSSDEGPNKALGSRVDSVKKIVFTELAAINLGQVDPDVYYPESMMIPMICEEIWQTHKYDNILRDIANDDLRAFFLSINNECLIAPYDGGVDMLFKNSETRDYYKAMYRDWLSTKPSGW